MLVIKKFFCLFLLNLFNYLISAQANYFQLKTELDTQLFDIVYPRCNASQWQCQITKKCIDVGQRCNFHNDCSDICYWDNSDEFECGPCNFDDLNRGDQPISCGWFNSGDGKSHWVIKNVQEDLSKYNGMLPKIDGKGSSWGSVMIIDASKVGTESYPAKLISPVLGNTGPNCKVQFAYHHNYPNNSYAKLSVNLLKKSSKTILPKTLMEINWTGQNWTIHTIHLGKLEPGYQIEFVGNGTTSASIQPYIDMELDEINFIDCDGEVTTSGSISDITGSVAVQQRSGIVYPACNASQWQCQITKKCIDVGQRCNFHNDCSDICSWDNSDENDCGPCNFDDLNRGDQPISCGWFNSGDSKNLWVIKNVQEDLFKYNGMLPKVDGKGSSWGSFMIIDASKGGNENNPAKLISPVLGNTGPNCKVQFAYHHNYPNNSYAKFSVNLFKKSSQTILLKSLMEITSVQNWTNHTVPLGKLEHGYQIEFVGIGTTSASIQPYIDIGLDEINFIDCDGTSSI